MFNPQLNCQLPPLLVYKHLKILKIFHLMITILCHYLTFKRMGIFNKNYLLPDLSTLPDSENEAGKQPKDTFINENITVNNFTV